MIVAIDGPAASGKGTLARRLAAHLGRAHLDTGLLYRAVACALLDEGHQLTDREAAQNAAANLDPTRFDEVRLRARHMGEAASVVSAYPAVRAALLALQRRFAAQPGGAVLDGRDIGTVVCPEADVKLFVTASPEERARRRYREVSGTGDTATLETVLEDIQRRDERDRTRGAAPLRAAADAVVIDTTALGPDEAFARALDVVVAKCGVR
jgi:CMP/dCMP kinase